MNQEEEIVIDIKDICCRLLLKWRLIFIVGFVSALLGLGAGFIMNYGNNMAAMEQLKAQETALNGGETEFFDNYLTDMTDSEIEQLTNVMKQYKDYRNEYDKTLEHFETSLYMNMNAENVLTYMKQYYVELNKEITSEVDYNMVSDIASEYTSYIVRGADYDAMKTLTGLDLGSSYWKELISVQHNGPFLNIYVIAPNEEIAGSLIQIIDETVEAYTSQLKEYGQFTISVVAENSYVQKNNSVAKAQQDTLTQLNGYTKKLEDLSANLNVNQKGLYEALTEDIRIEKDLISLKSALIGGFLGVFIICGFILMRYIVNGRLQSDMEISSVYGLELIGTGCIKTKKKAFMSGIDTLIIRLFEGKNISHDVDDVQKRAEADIRIMMKQNDWKKLYLVTTSGDEVCAEFVKKLGEALVKDSYEVKGVSNVLEATESLSQMAEADCIALVERVDVSNRNHISRTLSLCERYKTPVLGAVVLREL